MFSAIVFHLLRTVFKVYDYVVWGDGNLTRSIVHYLSDYEVLWVIPRNENVTLTNIENSDMKIKSGSDFFAGRDIHFPKCTHADIKRIQYQTSFGELEIAEAEKKLLSISGERFPNCYYYFFDNKTVRSTQVFRHGIQRWIHERHGAQKNTPMKIFFDEGDFVRTNKLIYGETGNIDDLFRKFHVPKTNVSMKMLIGLKNSILKTKTINFKQIDKYEACIIDDTITFWTTADLAKGPPHKLKCVYDNTIPDHLKSCADKIMKYGDLHYVVEPRIFGMGALCKDLYHQRENKIICLAPQMLEPSAHWIRDFLILCILAKKF